MPPFTKVLVANRGEIAARVIRTARAMGYPTVAVYSEADAGSPHVALADEAVCLGPAPARESYLDGGKILEAARRTGADALHPGYGFLSENAQFAAACVFAGVQFVGPPPEAITAMGDKAAAKAKMIEAGVPCVPGHQGDDQSDEALAKAAEQVGFPLLVKAAAGGGGRGMRRVDAAADLPRAIDAARKEAQSAFGDGRLLLERLVEKARHVEIQVFADTHGEAIHLGERDCSAQRRYQKVVEECPSPAVDSELRDRMGKAAVAAAKAIGYVGAGTVELLLGPDGSFYFLEMNTRLQVEHPVTEMVTGLDLVEWQLRVAAGERLPLSQDQVRLRGHAIEVRLYAEDPYDAHRPQAGRVLAFRPPEGPGIRCDHGLRSGGEITAYYDPMVGKLIAHGADREQARRKLRLALADTVLLGIESNRRFLADVLAHPTFIEGGVTTGWLENELDGAFTERPAPSPELIALAAALWSRGETPAGDGWRNSGSPEFPLEIRLHEAEHAVRVLPGAERWTVTAGGRATEVRLVDRDGPRVRVRIDGVERIAHAAWTPGALHLALGLESTLVTEILPAGAEAAEVSDGTLRAPSSGGVTSVSVAVGDRVDRGHRLLTLEAMKIESELLAAIEGTVSEVRVAVGDQVRRDQVLVVVTPDGAPETDGGGNGSEP